MGPPERLRYLVAEGCAAGPSLDLDGNEWLPRAQERFLVRLCRAVGLGAPSGEDAARERLERCTAELLATLRMPAALLVRPGCALGGTPDRLLTIALLSRSSERVFLARRTPDLRREVLSRRLRVAVPGPKVPA